MKIKRTTGPLGHERLTIKTFAHTQDGHAFLNRQTDNKWAVYDGPLTAGTYAFAGGQWHNVKMLDKTLLAHI